MLMLLFSSTQFNSIQTVLEGGSRAFSMVGPITWNCLPSYLRVLLTRYSVYSFYKEFETVLYRQSWTGRASEYLSLMGAIYVRWMNTGAVNSLPAMDAL